MVTGQGTWFAIVGQYAGIDKWEAEIKNQEQFMPAQMEGSGALHP